MSNDWKKDVSLMMSNAVWNWSTEKYKAYVTLINDLYNYKIFKVGEYPIKPLKVGDEETLPLAKKAVFKYIEEHSTGESISKAQEFIENVNEVHHSNVDRLKKDGEEGINGLVAEFTKHASDALSALSKIQTTTANSNNLYISVQAKELIDEFSKFWKKSENFRKKYRKP